MKHWTTLASEAAGALSATTNAAMQSDDEKELDLAILVVNKANEALAAINEFTNNWHKERKNFN